MRSVGQRAETVAIEGRALLEHALQAGIRRRLAIETQNLAQACGFNVEARYERPGSGTQFFRQRHYGRGHLRPA